MITQVIRHIVWVLAVGVTMACQTVTPDTLNQEVADAAITAAVKTKIVTDPHGPFGQADIETIENRVYLTGVVATEEDKRQAHAMALEVPGVTAVVNKLRVDEQQARSAMQASLAPVPIGREVQGEVLRIDGEDLVVRDTTNKEVRLQVDSHTEMTDTVDVGDKIQADVAIGRHADRVRKLKDPAALPRR
jgi:hyperosmotically inducible protein